MAVKIRLARRGRKKQPFYHVVVADARSPRDGKFIEQIGSYNPLTKPATIDLDRERAYYWLSCGAQPTHTARAILRFKGVLYKNHLQKGVSKGAITQEEADRLFSEFIQTKDSKIKSRFDAESNKKKEILAKLDGGNISSKPESADAAEKAVFLESVHEVVAPAVESQSSASEEE